MYLNSYLKVFECHGQQHQQQMQLCIKKMFSSGVAARIISNEEINNIMEIVKSPEESGFLIKGVGETIQNEAKEPKSRFLSMLRVTLGASLLENLLTELKVKSINRVKELKGKK